MAQPDIIVGQLIKVDQFRGQFIFMKSAGCINVTEAISGYIIWPRKMAWIFQYVSSIVVLLNGCEEKQVLIVRQRAELQRQSPSSPGPIGPSDPS
jgi:hypothetical protein